MFDSNNTNNNNNSTLLSSDAWQSITRYSPFTAQSIQNTISQVPFFFNTTPEELKEESTVMPYYPCPHKDLFSMAKQIDNLPKFKCRYNHNAHSFIIMDTESEREIGELTKDIQSNQIVLTNIGYYTNLFERLITMDLDCDLLVLLYRQNNSQFCTKGVYRVNAVG